MNHSSSIFIGALLVAGTSIGGGMLALPVLTSVTGFIPSLFVYFACWLFMVCTGLLFLEITQWMHKKANIISMAESTLGRGGKAAAWMLYLFLFYSLNIAYIVELGKTVVEISSGAIADWMGPIVFVALFAPCVLIPTALAAKMNLGLMAGLIFSYIFFIALGISSIKPSFLASANWLEAPKALPIAFTAFAYQGIIPTLAHYFDYDIQKGKKAIVIGSLITLSAYLIWQVLILGIVPIEGANGLKEALGSDLNAIQAMRHYIDHDKLYIMGQSFAFFALVTSFLGVTLGLRDFLADGLNITSTPKGSALLLLLIFLPPLMIGIIYPHIFLIMLSYAGGIGCALLLGLFPIIMVWKGRKKREGKGEQKLVGGSVCLASLALFVVCEVAMELVSIFKEF